MGQLKGEEAGQEEGPAFEINPQHPRIWRTKAFSLVLKRSCAAPRRAAWSTLFQTLRLNKLSLLREPVVPAFAFSPTVAPLNSNPKSPRLHDRQEADVEGGFKHTNKRVYFPVCVYLNFVTPLAVSVCFSTQHFCIEMYEGTFSRRFLKDKI